MRFIAIIAMILCILAAGDVFGSDSEIPTRDDVWEWDYEWDYEVRTLEGSQTPEWFIDRELERTKPDPEPLRCPHEVTAREIGCLPCHNHDGSLRGNR